MRANTAIRLALCLAACLVAGASAAQDSKPTKNEIKEIKEFLTDTASGQVSAASLLGIGGDAVTAVENNRTLVAALKALGTKDSQVALSFTPARSSLLPMNLSDYADSNIARLVGNTTIGYAQGTSKVGDTDVARRAFSIETGMTFRREDDPLIAVYADCKWKPPAVQPGQKEDLSEANKQYTDCIAKKEAELAKRWNTSRFSLSLGSGTVIPNNAQSTRLGTTVAAHVVYGFDHFGIDVLKSSAAIALTVRHTRDEPVLDQLVKGTLVRKNSNLAALRLSGGSATARGLAEVSNAKTQSGTASQQVYKHALGVDLNVGSGQWLNIRSGKQAKTTGTGTETVTMLTYSISPKAGLL